MLNTYTVSFFGHREVDNFSQIRQQVQEIIYELLQTKQYVQFLVGRNGEFDRLVSSVIRSAQKNYRHDNSCHVLVLPYYTAEYDNNYDNFNCYYDHIEICNKSYKAHFKAAIYIRNKDMVDKSDMIVFYLERKQGGAYKTYKYAVDHGKALIKIPIFE